MFIVGGSHSSDIGNQAVFFFSLLMPTRMFRASQPGVYDSVLRTLISVYDLMWWHSEDYSIWRRNNRQNSSLFTGFKDSFWRYDATTSPTGREVTVNICEEHSCMLGEAVCAHKFLIIHNKSFLKYSSKLWYSCDKVHFMFCFAPQIQVTVCLLNNTFLIVLVQISTYTVQ